jgi:branched-chain amino acid transport system substrate-binding protein
MKKLSSFIVISCLLTMLASLYMAGLMAREAAAETKTLKIGLITSATGPMSPAFKPIVDAAKPSEELINQRGGITVKGQKYNIKVIVMDDQSSPPGAVAAANKLMQEGIKFMIPPMFMPCNMAIAPITEEAKMLRMKSFGMGPQEVNPKLRYSFYASASIHNIRPTYDYLGKNYPNVKKVAILAPDDPGLLDAKKLCEKTIKERGMEIVFNELFTIGTEDFYPLLTKALAKKPDAIDCVVSIIPWAAGVINQSRELGFKGPIYAPCIFGDINILNKVLKKEYAYDIFHGGPDVLSDKMLPIVKDLRKLWEQKKTGPFQMEGVIVLDGLVPLLQGIEKAQSLDPDKVVDTLENMKSVDTIWGKGKMGGMEIFGINHVVIRPITLSRIMHGKVEFDFLK